MQSVELFCGTKSFSKVAAARGYKTFTVDNDPRHQPDLDINVLALNAKDLPFRPEILWASPPCTSFSVASIGHHWHLNGTPKTENAIVAQQIVLKTLSLIRETSPRWWFIENPRGMLRTMPFMKGYRRVTVSYCQYGDTRMKPTDIWTNATWWEPRQICRPGASCHQSAPRGAKTGTQGIKGAVERGRIPPALFEEIFSQQPQLIGDLNGSIPQSKAA